MFGKAQRDELLNELARLRQQVAQLEAERDRGLLLDSVTGVLSMRAFRGRLTEEVDRSRRYKRALSLAVVSLDDFASVELQQGFVGSDALLAATARRLGAATRSHDVVGRIAHAEFGLLLPDTEANAALPALERLLVDLELLGEGNVRISGASMGVAGLRSGMSAEAFLAAARLARNEAQEKGGGRAELAAATDGGGEVVTQAPQQDAIEALALALLERDRYTGEHSEAVIDMSGAVARNLGCSSQDIERVKSAALLHDIGKVAIPDRILHKPGPLTDEEWKLMKEHPVIGERILRVLPGLGTVARIVRHEHERWDGTGYPDGLAGEDIPLGSRIIIAADTYHAMTSDRPYREAMPHREAAEELTRCAGSQFDPDVIQALIGYIYGQRQAGLIA